MSCPGGSDDHTAKELIFEAQRLLDKEQQEAHGGVVRGTDAAKVQVWFTMLLPEPKHSHIMPAVTVNLRQPYPS